jgi:hypothetical protein
VVAAFISRSESSVGMTPMVGTGWRANISIWTASQMSARAVAAGVRTVDDCRDRGNRLIDFDPVPP